MSIVSDAAGVFSNISTTMRFNLTLQPLLFVSYGIFVSNNSLSLSLSLCVYVRKTVLV